MTTVKSITGQEFKVSPNYSKRTFTIKTNGLKYRTVRLSKQEFESCLYNTGNDWSKFLRTSDYYLVR